MATNVANVIFAYRDLRIRHRSTSIELPQLERQPPDRSREAANCHQNGSTWWFADRRFSANEDKPADPET
jgi:hypothetical protein